jgi:hypothetical protein
MSVCNLDIRAMIECKYILSLCDRFEDYLMPLDIHMLRQRYNGQVLKSTYAVARDMGISDETVRDREPRPGGAGALPTSTSQRPKDRAHAPGKGH